METLNRILGEWFKYRFTRQNNRLSRFFCLSCLILSSLVLLQVHGAVAQSTVEEVLKLDEKWTGNFDGMVERHTIRALVPYSKTFYFLDRADQRGITYDMLKAFEKYVNKQLKKKTWKLIWELQKSQSQYL